MIGTYPDLTELELTDRPLLDPLFRRLHDGISELTFAGIYCFRQAHAYHITRMPDDTIALTGSDKGQCFFICPFALPRRDLLEELFTRCRSMKLATTTQAEQLRAAGYEVIPDRDNFDYLYRREQLASLAGRALQRKRNLVHAFERSHDYRCEPLAYEQAGDALQVLEGWRSEAHDLADYAPAKEALEHTREFGLVGRITYVEDQPGAYALGEYAVGGTMFVVHYEKTIPGMKGLYQLVNRDLAQALPTTVALLNLEQDLGEPGLRQSKMTYRPCDFVRKYRARRPGDS
jgi:hypothetical protein